MRAKEILNEIGEQHQLSLGEMIVALRKGKSDQRVTFDWCRLSPGGLASYRGYYDQLALGFNEDGRCTVGELLAQLERAVGATFEGYKGGACKMDRATRVYVANYGDSHGVGVVGVEVHSYGGVTLRTAVVDSIYQWHD